ncbi:helix-turn-helix DNA binding domain protein [Arthrobacter phage TforTroy]|uniref:Helix-turn-helix DNA binding domain protein n=1 Tax=Arthrobacter phage TforTroy TaxID=3118973 RepID=A0ABZ2CLI6_9CAUD
MPARKVDLDELRRLHDEGWHRDELAAHFGVAPDVVTRSRRALGLPLDPPRHAGGAPRKVDRDEFARLDPTMTLPELASHFGVSLATAVRVRRELGLARDHFLTQERLARIEAMLDDGWSFKEIHRTEGVDEETLRHHFPGRQWSKAQANEYRAACRYYGEQIEKAAYVATKKDLRKSSLVP